LETEVEKLDCSDVEYQSSMGFLTEDEIAILASAMPTPYASKSINEMIEIKHKNAGN
jgi:hypothetical protein